MARSYDVPVTLPIGSTITATGGANNSKLLVEANGQILNRTAYPELSTLYANQTSAEFAGGTMIGSGTSFMMPTQSYNGTRLISTQNSSYAFYAQQVTEGNQTGTAFWSSANGDDWKLIDIIIGTGSVLKVKSIGTTVFVCCANGLYRTTDGLTITQVSVNGISDIAFDNTNYLLLGQSGNICLRTTNFVTFTSITLPSSNHFAIEYLGTNFWLFSTGVATVWGSTDAGTTWTASAISPPNILNANNTIVLNNILIYFRYVNNAPLFNYTTNPASVAWTASTSTFVSGMGGVQGMIYDASTTTYVAAIGRQSGSSGETARIFTTISSSGSIFYSSTSLIATNTDSVVFAFGGNKYFLIAGHYQVKRTTWSNAGCEWYDVDARQTPTFGLSGFYTAGSTTALGKRALVRQCGSGSTQFYLSVLIEENGYFKPIINGTNSQGYWISGSSSSFTAHALYEGTDGYAVVYTDGGQTNWFWATANANKVGLTSSSSGTPSPSTGFVMAPIGNSGIVLWNPSAASSRTVYRVTPLSSSVITWTWTLATSSSQTVNMQLLSTNELLVTELDSTSPTSNPSWYLMNSAQIIQQRVFSLTNSSGASVSVNSGAKIFRLNNVYYCVQTSTLYVANDGSSFSELQPVTQLTSSQLSFTDFNSNVVFGNSIFRSSLGNLNISTINTTGGTNRTTPNIFQVNSSKIYLGLNLSAMNMYGAIVLLPYDSTTQIKLPQIKQTTAGLSTYIVAR